MPQAVPQSLKIACALCSDSEAKKEEEKPKEDQHRPGFGRGYFAAANDSIGASGDAANSSKPDDKAPAAALVSWKRDMSDACTL